MARFDVYANPDSGERRHTPYFVDVQNDFIDGLATRVVIPLRKEAVFGPGARDLNPKVGVLGNDLVLRHERELIDEALDALFAGY